ncbi:DNA polymerase III subunit beta [Clostridium sp. MSJ-4]|uniref:Beta sliding clamp n=1 Tax=Clostridium simiarum TaxID=2841506 RepID=A0ABS6F3F3_9CLOT|nr:DNA polymerase III subunit beta [Clostridium simiarum]MBU5592415.1 DNA polymerase III subunit beta [Clostridium simiarum]
MKFTCEKSNLQEAISIVQKAVTGRSPMPILEGIFIEAINNELRLIGSDIDLSIETKINANIIESGRIVVDSKIFGEIIRKLPNDEIAIETTENNSIIITCQNSIFNLIHLNADEFPSLPNIDDDMMFVIPQSTLKNMIRGTSFAIAQDETRPILTGILFEINDKMLNMVALDGYRLAIRNEYIDTENSISAVIPGKTLNEVAKVLEDTNEIANITFTTNHILFNLGVTKIISRLLEGEFIKYSSIIPQEFNLKVTVNKQKLQNGIERASLMAKEGNANLIKLDIEDESMVITSNSQLGKVREEVAINLQGTTLQIAFNSKYLLDVLKIMDEEEVVMEFSSSVSPCVVKNKEKNNCKYLVLPVRLAK